MFIALCVDFDHVWINIKLIKHEHRNIAAIIGGEASCPRVADCIHDRKPKPDAIAKSAMNRNRLLAIPDKAGVIISIRLERSHFAKVTKHPPCEDANMSANVYGKTRS